MTTILFSPAIGPVSVDVIVTEGHTSSLGITENPIETGAKITDHAYVEPKRLRLELVSATAVDTFNALVRFQESRVPFVLVSGLYVYRDMLIKTLDVTRDVRTSRIMDAKCELQEAIIVSTSYTTAEGEDLDSSTTGGQKKTAQPGGKKSTTAARPSSARAGDAATSDRAAGTTTRGDAAAKTVTGSENQSILSKLVSG